MRQSPLPHCSSARRNHFQKGRATVLGIRVQSVQDEAKQPQLSDSFRASCSKWLDFRNNAEECDVFSAVINEELDKMKTYENPYLQTLNNYRNLLRKQSHWLSGGDGWAYDIGLGGG